MGERKKSASGGRLICEQVAAREGKSKGKKKKVKRSKRRRRKTKDSASYWLSAVEGGATDCRPCAFPAGVGPFFEASFREFFTCCKRSSAW